MNRKIPTRQQIANRAGRRAFLAGWSRSKCPYTSDIRLIAEWYSGWDSAFLESRK